MQVHFTDRDPISCTVSIGAAEVGVGTDNPTDLMARADTALYRAKAEGRNRVCLSD
jgi:diguanylate cyclase (GGDEF)-like protein